MLKRSGVCWVLGSSLLMAGAFAACKPRVEDSAALNVGVSSPANTFDVNDVSYLFPLKSGAPVPSISATDSLGDGDVWPVDLFNSVINFSQTRNIGSRSFVSDRNSWRMYSFRFDPCAPTLDPAFVAAKGCKVQIRFIAQPFVGGLDMDFSAHLVYTLGSLNKEKTGYENKQPGQPSLKELLEDLQDLKKSSPVKTSGAALGVHPGLARDNGGPYAAKVKAFLVKHMQSRHLAAVAFMGLEGQSPEPWIFFAGGVVPTAGGKPITDPKDAAKADGRIWFPVDVPSNKGEKSILLSFIDSRRVIPEPGVTPNIKPLFDFSLNDQKVLGTVHDIDHPDHKHFFNMDCVSCHATTTRMTNKRIRAGSNPDRFRTPKGITGYMATDVIPRNQWNVRNFGYFFGAATVTSRTVTESAAVADFTNRELLGGENPGLVCPQDPKVADDIWDCIVLEGIQEKQCFAKFGCKVDGKGISTQLSLTSTQTAVPPSRVQSAPTPKSPSIAACSARGNARGEFAKAGFNNDGGTFKLSIADSKCLSQHLQRGFSGVMVKGNEQRQMTIQCSSGSECAVGGFAKKSIDKARPNAGVSQSQITRAFRKTLQDQGTFKFASTSKINGKPAFSISCNKTTCEVSLAAGKSSSVNEERICGALTRGDTRFGGDNDLRLSNPKGAFILSFANDAARQKANEIATSIIEKGRQACAVTDGKRLQGFEGTLLVVNKVTEG